MFGRSILPRKVQEGLAQVGGPGSKTIEVSMAYTPALKAFAVARLEAALAEGRLSRTHYWDPKTKIGSPVAIVSVYRQPKDPKQAALTSFPEMEELAGGDQPTFRMTTGLPPMIAWIFEPIFRGLPHDEAFPWALEFFRDHLPDNVQIPAAPLWGDLAGKVLLDEKFGMLRLASCDDHARLIRAVAAKLASDNVVAGELLSLVKQPVPKGVSPYHASPVSEAAVAAAEVRIEGNEMLSCMAAAQTLRSAAEAAARDAASKVTDGVEARAAADEARFAMHRQQVIWLRESIESTRVVSARDWRNPLAKAEALFSRVPRIGQGAKPSSGSAATAANQGRRPWGAGR